MRTLQLAMILMAGTSAMGSEAVDQPLSEDVLRQFTQSMLSGESLSYGLYGKQPITWLVRATGDEMLRRARTGQFPDDDSFKHVSFIYGSYWDNCRRYYMAYRITGELAFIEQLRQYARLMDWILKERPWLVLPKERRYPRPADPVATIPHEPAAASNFIGYVLAARLTLQLARADRTRVSDEQVAEARAFLETTVKYMASRVSGDGAIDEKLGLPTVVAEIIRTTPYNQSFMYYAVLGISAVALADLQQLDGSRKYQQTIDLYRRIVCAGIEKFLDHSDVTEINGKPYVFHSHSPADQYEQIRDPQTHQRVPWIIDGHPVFHYPEDVPHSQSQAWNLMLLWETDQRFGVTESLLTGIANTHVDYVLRGEAPLKGGEVGPPMHILSPWTLQARSQVKWSRLGRPSLVYAIYLPFRADIAQATRELSARGKKEMDGPEGQQFILFAHYLQAIRPSRGLLHLPSPK